MSKYKTVIRIANPLPGGSAYTNHRRATELVRAGRARRVGAHLIEFVHSMEKAIQSAATSHAIRENINPNDRSAGGMATLDQIAGVPVITPQKLIREGCDRFAPRASRRGVVRYPSATFDAHQFATTENQFVPLNLDQAGL